MTITSMTFYALYIYNVEKNAWQGRQGEAARNAAGTVNNFLTEISNFARFIDRLGLDELSESDSTVLDNLLNELPYVIEIAYFDSNGTYLSGSFRDKMVLANQFTITQAEWFLQAKNGNIYYSRVQVSSDNAPYMIAAYPVQSEKILAFRVKMDLLWQVVEDIRFGKNGRVYVVNQNGQIMAYTDRNVVLQNLSMPDSSILTKIKNSTNGEWFGNIKSFNGEQVVSATAPIGNTGWFVITELPIPEAFSGTKRTVTSLTLITLVLGILTIWAIERLMDRSFLRPLEKLKLSTEKIGAGDLFDRVTVFGDDEIGQLGQSFNEMTARLAEQKVRLQKELTEREKAEYELQILNVDLENKIQSRMFQLSKSLREKDVLAKEVHHRVKNNLQLVSSLLSLQIRKSDDVNLQSGLIDSQSRIHSMALIHEKLYQSESLEQINLGEYIYTLASYLFETYNTNAGIKFDMHSAPVFLDINLAVPCGLLVNEVVTNSLKYAFTERQGGVIKVLVEKMDDSMIRLCISDNGQGLSQEFGTYNDSLGMQLIQSFAMQLDGRLVVNAHSGTEYILTFKGFSEKHG